MMGWDNIFPLVPFTIGYKRQHSAYLESNIRCDLILIENDSVFRVTENRTRWLFDFKDGYAFQRNSLKTNLSSYAVVARITSEECGVRESSLVVRYISPYRVFITH